MLCDMCYVKILGIRIDKVSKEEALKKVSSFFGSNKQHTIFTPNPEILVDAQKDAYFREILNEGDLNLCDGFGLSVFARTKRIPGVDFMVELCQLAEQKNYSVYFLGSGSEQIIKNLKLAIGRQFPNIKIAGAHQGYQLPITNYQLQMDTEKNNELVADIVTTQPDILFVAFGHNKQEKWIYENLKDLPSVRIAMGVGGAFDFISGNKKRAPKWMRQVGLEWLYRLVQEPNRFKRIWKATGVFVYYFIFKNIQQ